MVNYVAVLVAAIAAFVVGALWYGPIFGKVWRREMGMDDMQPSMKGMGSSMVGGFIATLVLVWVLAEFYSMWYITTLPTALLIAFWIWLGFIATVMTNVMWYEKKSFKLYVINVAHYLVAILVAAAVLIWI
ncbi:MAG: DUF1761 domain-containing protein [Minisyncoccia bacterium]